MQSDAVNPRLQTGLTVEMLHSAENLQKHFLGRVGRIGRVIHDAVDEPVDGLVKLANQPGVCFFRSRL